MARIDYADLEAPNVKPLVDQIVAERGSVLILYQMLLNSPDVAKGWLNHLTGIRLNSTLPGDLREMVIMRVAILNRAPYEADQHAPIALKEGMTQEQLDALEEWHKADCFSDLERAVLEYTDEMTLNVQVADRVFANAKQYFNNQHMVELTATIATYNMVSRFLEALQIHTADEEKA